MNKDSTTGASTEGLFAGEAWFDPIEAGLHGRIRSFIEAMLEEELAAALGGGRYERGHRRGHRHGKRARQLLGSFGPTTISVPETRRRAFLRKWQLKHRAVADSLEEAGDRLFTFTRLPASQWRSARTTNAIERLHEEFKRRIKTQTVLPSAETAAMLFWALLASGQITMRKVDGWPTLAQKPTAPPIDRAA